MDITLEQFEKLMINKVNALVAANDRREKPWTRVDFVRYIKGACDWFFFEHNVKDDPDYMVANIYCDSDIIAEIEAAEKIG